MPWPNSLVNTADGRGWSGDDAIHAVEKVQEQFVTYNKKFNRTHERYLMEFRSFRRMTRDIPCLRYFKSRERFEVFNVQSTDGCLTFSQFQKALNHFSISVGREGPIQASDDTLMNLIYQIQDLNPNNIRQWFKSLLNAIVDDEPAIPKVSSAAGNALKEIGKTTVKDLAHVGTAVAWIGPAVKVLVIIWRRIVAFEEITDDLVKFADTLSYLTETIEFIEESLRYQTDMMKTRMLGLEKMLKKARNLFNSVEEHGNHKVKEFFLAEDNRRQLKDMEEELKKWSCQTYFVQLDENSHLTVEHPGLLPAMQKDLREFVQKNHSLLDKLEVLSLKTTDAYQYSDFQRDSSGKAILGKGTFGTVRSYRHKKTNEEIAVKEIELQPIEGQPSDDEKALREEVKIMCELSDYRHPNIILYLFHHFDEEYWRLCIGMEYIPGGSLQQKIRKEGHLSDHKIQNYTHQILLGVDFLHGIPIVHRDIKGGNILIGINDCLKLADFGISKQLTTYLKHHGATTAEMGSCQYMSPEALKGYRDDDSSKKGYGIKTDIWSVGCVVLEMATGKPPWNECSNNYNVMFRLGNNEAPPIDDNVSDDVKDFLAKTFKVNPQDRQSANELLGHKLAQL